MSSAYISLFILIAFAASYLLGKRAVETGMEAGNRLVLLNEIEQLTTDAEDGNPAEEEFQILKAALQKESAKGQAAYIRRVGFF